MGFINFLGRHVGAAVIAALGVILLALGYADQAANIWKGAEPWQLQAGGATLFVIAIGMVLYAFDKEQSGQRLATPFLQTTEKRMPVPQESSRLQLSPITSQPPSSAARVYVSAGTSPYTLMAMADGKTHFEGQRIISPFIGKWMRVEGIFADLSVNEYFSVLRMEREELARIAGVSFVYGTSIGFYFEQNRDQLEILRVGEKVVVEGKIKEIDGVTFKLENCELVQSGA